MPTLFYDIVLKILHKTACRIATEDYMYMNCWIFILLQSSNKDLETVFWNRLANFIHRYSIDIRLVDYS